MKTLLYIADNIQQIADGKLLMFGVYPDHVVQLNFPKEVLARPSKEMPTVIPAITIAVVLFDLPPGKREIAPKILLPTGEVSQNMSAISVETLEANTVNLLFNFAPLLVPMEGRYQLEFEVDGEKLSFPLTIKFKN